jgi:FAD/FMN-containing dehydrogenase
MAAVAPTSDGQSLQLPKGHDTCLVTMRDAVAPGTEPAPGPGHRAGPMSEVLLYDFTGPYREIEYAVDHGRGAQTLLELRARLHRDHPDYDHPILVRLVAADDSLLSWFRGGPKAAFSVTDSIEAPYSRVLEPMEALLSATGALPHWGKEHALDRSRLDRDQPGAAAFREVRRELDPTGLFLNKHLRTLFA